MRYIALICAAFTLTACLSTTEKPEAGLPLMPPNGTITSAALVGAFEEHCLQNFPNFDRYHNPLRQSGFVKESGPEGEFDDSLWEYARASDDLRIAFGDSFIHWSGVNTGGHTPLATCLIEANVTDPTSLHFAFQNIDVPPNATLAFKEPSPRNNFTDPTSLLRGNLEISGQSYEIESHISIRTRENRDNTPRPECDGFASCRFWSQALLRVNFINQ